MVSSPRHIGLRPQLHSSKITNLGHLSAIDFKPYSENSPLAITRGNLPHWSQTGVTYFVTFRLADSIPLPALKRWKEKRAHWLAVRKITDFSFNDLSPDDKNEYRREFGEKLEALMDNCHGSCLLRDPALAQIVAQALEHFDHERYFLHGYVIMPNHVHLLTTLAPTQTLSKTLQSWKRFTAREINKARNTSGAIWQRESFDHIVRSATQLAHFKNYLHENPQKEKLREDEYILKL